MRHKTTVTAEPSRQEIVISRFFDLPVHLVFRAYTEPALIEQWMGNNVLKMDCREHGGYQFETKDPDGNVLFRANGSIHAIDAGKSMIRTFEMENTEFPVQLEFLDFEPVSEKTSRLTIKIVFKSVADRDNLLKLPFAQGIDRAHATLQSILESEI